MSYNIPILLIVYNRVDKTRQLLNIIEKIKPKKLFISADGPKQKNEDIKNCKEVRKIFDNINFKFASAILFLFSSSIHNLPHDLYNFYVLTGQWHVPGIIVLLHCLMNVYQM